VLMNTLKLPAAFRNASRAYGEWDATGKNRAR
jgi:hypothetical protein